MPNLKDLKNRIESVKSTRKITKAMQMVAAAKLRRGTGSGRSRSSLRRAVQRRSGWLAASSGGDSAPKLLSGTGSDQVHMLVVMTAERGLCGGFNSSIAKLARAKAEELIASGKTVKMLTVGKKGREQLKRDFGDQMVDHVDLSAVRNVGYDNAQAIANDLIHRFNEGEFDVATIFYNKFESVISQIPTAQQVIPASFDAPAEGAEEVSTVYDYEPSEEGILATLLPSGVATQVFTALLENGASEQGARMSAMDNATRNAGDMIDKLTIQFNRSRQAVITNELIEIISGAEAL